VERSEGGGCHDEETGREGEEEEDVEEKEEEIRFLRRRVNSSPLLRAC